MTTATLQDTIVSLDTLLSSYKAILEQAYEQLSTLELDTSQLASIGKTATQDHSFLRQVSDNVFESLRNDIRNSNVDESYAYRSFLTALENQCFGAIEAKIDKLISERVGEALASAELDQAITMRLRQHRELRSAAMSERVLMDMMALVFDSDQIILKLAEAKARTNVD